MILCPKCHTENIEGSKFCYKCGNELEKITEDNIELVNKCLSCGANNPPSINFCLFCGTRLAVNMKSKPQSDLLNYWYCKYDGALMSETSSNHQFLVAKDIESSVEQLIKENKIKPDHANQIQEIANKVFKDDLEKNFAVLTRVRCPLCLRDSYASVYTQPRRN